MKLVGWWGTKCHRVHSYRSAYPHRTQNSVLRASPRVSDFRRIFSTSSLLLSFQENLIAPVSSQLFHHLCGSFRGGYYNLQCRINDILSWDVGDALLRQHYCCYWCHNEQTQSLVIQKVPRGGIITRTTDIYTRYIIRNHWSMLGLRISQKAIQDKHSRLWCKKICYSWLNLSQPFCEDSFLFMS